MSTTIKAPAMHLTAEQVRATMEAVRLTQEDEKMTAQEFAEEVGCSRPQLFRYLKEGLPLRMNALIRRNLVRLASERGVIWGAPQEAGVFL